MTQKITTTEIREIAYAEGLAHAEFVVGQQASEFGQAHVDTLLAEIAKLADATYDPDNA
jgi:hypothetical protein